MEEEKKEYITVKYIGSEYDGVFAKDKVYEGYLTGRNKGIFVIKDDCRIIRDFGYKGTPWHKDKRFIDNFKQI